MGDDVISLIPRISRKLFIEEMIGAAIKGGYTPTQAMEILFNYVCQAFFYGEVVKPERYLEILETEKAALLLRK